MPVTPLPAGESPAWILRSKQILPTRQRILMLTEVRSGGCRHLSPDSFHRQLTAAGHKLSLATVYNTLNQFAAAGLVRRVGVGDRVWFCTSTDSHHHFYNESRGTLETIQGSQPEISNLPAPPQGTEICGIDLVIRLRDCPTECWPGRPARLPD